MINYAFRLFLLIVPILVCTSSCNPGSRSSVDNKITFDTVNVVKYYHLNNDSTQPSCNLRVNLVYPVGYENEAVLSKLQKIFVGRILDDSYASMDIKPAIDKYIADYIANYKEDAKFYLDKNVFEDSEFGDSYFSYYEHLSNEIIFNKDDLLSLQIVRSNKKGNNDTFRQYINHVINLKTGELVTESDIFNEGYEMALNTIFKQKLFFANNVSNVDDLETLGFFGIDEMIPNKNFLVNEEGITYIFNKGEYSVPRSAEIRIFIPYEEMVQILKEKSPISIYFNQG